MNTAAELIQIMLAPGIMISACGLLLLGMNNKYSLVVNRIRLLKEEKRSSSQLELSQNPRHGSIDLQVNKLFYRISLIRNAVFSYSIAVALFIISSFLIGLNKINGPIKLNFLVIGFFLIGMACVFVGVMFAAVEVWKGYKIVKIEIEDPS